jgi:hypothetical protein
MRGSGCGIKVAQASRLCSEWEENGMREAEVRMQNMGGRI